MLLNRIERLKARLDRIRPLPQELVENLREVYDIRFPLSEFFVTETDYVMPLTSNSIVQGVLKY